MELKNIQISPVLESTTTEVALEMVRQGIGVGNFPIDVINAVQDKDNFEIITFNEELPSVDLCCVYMKEFLTAATNKFIETMTKNK